MMTKIPATQGLLAILTAGGIGFSTLSRIAARMRIAVVDEMRAASPRLGTSTLP
jgi:hypothetical protein